MIIRNAYNGRYVIASFQKFFGSTGFALLRDLWRWRQSFPPDDWGQSWQIPDWQVGPSRTWSLRPSRKSFATADFRARRSAALTCSALPRDQFWPSKRIQASIPVGQPWIGRQQFLQTFFLLLHGVQLGPKVVSYTFEIINGWKLFAKILSLQCSYSILIACEI